MARTNLATASIHNLDRDTGTDITAVAGDTITAGAGDGLIIPYKTNNVLVLRNGTGFAATVTIKVVNPSQAEAVNLAVADKTLSIADGDTILYPLSAIFRPVLCNGLKSTWMTSVLLIPFQLWGYLCHKYLWSMSQIREPSRWVSMS